MIEREDFENEIDSFAMEAARNFKENTHQTSYTRHAIAVGALIALRFGEDMLDIVVIRIGEEPTRFNNVIKLEPKEGMEQLKNINN